MEHLPFKEMGIIVNVVVIILAGYVFQVINSRVKVLKDRENKAIYEFHHVFVSVLNKKRNILEDLIIKIPD